MCSLFANCYGDGKKSAESKKRFQEKIYGSARAFDNFVRFVAAASNTTLQITKFYVHKENKLDRF